VDPALISGILVEIDADKANGTGACGYLESDYLTLRRSSLKPLISAV
jgi:hypothetical protein